MPPTEFLNNVFVFGRLLRSLGIAVHVGRLVDVAEALPLVNLASREEVYHTCRALLIHRHEDLAVFDRAFEAFWCEQRSARDVGDVAVPPRELDAPQAVQEPLAANLQPIAIDDESEVSGGPPSTEDSGTWSDAEIFARKDFAQFTPHEMAQAHSVLDRLAWTPGERRTRRWLPGRGARLDVRRAIARSLRTGGEIVDLPTRTRGTRPRSIVLLCDVSGSMERYSRMLLHFAHALGQRHARLEAFVFSTRLTRITPQLRNRRLDVALEAASRAVPDWAGGTRIGGAIRDFHRNWARRVLRGRPIVLLISDGWDRGDPVVLRSEVARLQRSCQRLVWLSPLAAAPEYAPLTRGLQAALPFVDDFLPAGTLANLAELAAHLNALAWPGRHVTRRDQLRAG
jgi:uncharacterized protein with von Willebrand factor type A (vWA) domain